MGCLLKHKKRNYHCSHHGVHGKGGVQEEDKHESLIGVIARAVPQKARDRKTSFPREVILEEARASAEPLWVHLARHSAIVCDWVARRIGARDRLHSSAAPGVVRAAVSTRDDGYGTQKQESGSNVQRLASRQLTNAHFWHAAAKSALSLQMSKADSTSAWARMRAESEREGWRWLHVPARSRRCHHSATMQRA